MKKLLLLLSIICIQQINAQCTVSVTGDTTVCAGSCTTFTASGATSYQWFPGGATTSTISVCPGSNTTYTVYGTGALACTSSITVNVTVNPSPVASYTYGLISCCNIGAFTDSSKVALGDSIVAWYWTFDIGSPSTSTSQNPSVYLNFGNDTVCLTVTTSHGCKDSTCQIVNENVMSAKELNSLSFVSIYPNPASNEFFIEAKSTEKLIVDLYDLNGRHVFSKNVNGKSFIDVTGLNEGVYSMTIKTVNSILNKKLVIVR